MQQEYSAIMIHFSINPFRIIRYIFKMSGVNNVRRLAIIPFHRNIEILFKILSVFN